MINFNEKYLDCECLYRFIHSKEDNHCVKCGALQDEQPPSIAEEVRPENLALGVSLNVYRTDTRKKVRKLAKKLRARAEDPEASYDDWEQDLVRLFNLIEDI